MKKTIFILFILSITICNAQNNIILNGSFELNNATDCFEELYTQSDYNATVSFSTSFGYAIVLMQDSCLRCPSQTFWGGEYKMAIDLLIYLENLLSLLRVMVGCSQSCH